MGVAIVKASYTRARGGAKAAIRYITHRPAREQTRVTRELFSLDGRISRQEAYRIIDEAVKGSVFFRFVVSPDVKTEDRHKDLHLRSVTEHTMQTLEARLRTPVVWVAAVHDDHTPHRHVHIVAVVSGRIEREDLLVLRHTATAACLEQRRQHDLVRQQQARDHARSEEGAWELALEA